MVLSMTGFGRAEKVADGHEITFEIKSVNHRYFEYYGRIPKIYGALEEPIKKLVHAEVTRGKVEVYLVVKQSEGINAKVSLNHGLLESYLSTLREMIEKYGLRDDISATAVSRFPDVFIVDEQQEDEEVLTLAVLDTVSAALSSYNQMRADEGAKLAADIIDRIGIINGFVTEIEESAPRLNAEYYERLKGRIEKILEGVEIDEGRLLTEAAVFADKTNVTEEIVRLRSHIAQFTDVLSQKKGDPVGKKLDFVIQEMNREVNTIGSKCNDSEIAKTVISAKAEIEKIREQIQNLE